ncbi:MAG: hypothetical protein C0597_16110, partial [Marinilabiliales bacterium]
MRSIFGRINFNQNPVNSTLFTKSLESFFIIPEVKKELAIESHIGFGQVHCSSLTIKTNHAKDKNLIFVSDSIIYNKEKLAEILQLNQREITDDEIILKSYEKWNEKCVEYLIGDFSFAIWNLEAKELFCARDHLGVKPFHYYKDENCFVFSTDIASILEQDDLNFSLDDQQVADTISIIKSEKFRTTYNEIKKLPPAHTLIIKNNKIEIKQYWELKPKKSLQKKDAEIISEFKRILIESVRCRIRENQVIGSELSGGVDSSTVTAIASSMIPIKTFSHVLPDRLIGKIHPFKDERGFINLLGDYCKITDRHFIK